MEKKHTYSDNEIIKIDRKERISKLGKRYCPEPPSDIIQSINRLTDNVNQMLIEFRRLNDILSYQRESEHEHRFDKKP